MPWPGHISSYMIYHNTQLKREIKNVQLTAEEHLQLKDNEIKQIMKEYSQLEERFTEFKNAQLEKENTQLEKENTQFESDDARQQIQQQTEMTPFMKAEISVSKLPITKLCARRREKRILSLIREQRIKKQGNRGISKKTLKQGRSPMPAVILLVDI